MKQRMFAAFSLVCVLGILVSAQDTPKPAVPDAAAQVDPINQQATQLEGELGKYKDSDAVAADTMVKLVDLYHQHGRVFGLVRIAQRFVTAHASDKRHADVMLKLIDGLEATSRNADMAAACRQFLDRYGKSEQAPSIEIRLANVLDQSTDRTASANAHRAIWQRQPQTEIGRQHGALAVSHYSLVNNKAVYSKAAELADEMLEKLPAGSFTEEVGSQGVAQWRRGSEWAKSNIVAQKMIKKNIPRDKQRLRQLHYYMGENYQNLGQWANAVASYRQARAQGDTADLHMRMIYAMYQNAATKPPEMAAQTTDYMRKYPQRIDRFTAQSHLAQVQLRGTDADKAAGLQTLKQLLPVAPRTNSNASLFVRLSGSEPPQLAALEQSLRTAVTQSKIPYETAYIRYVLAFEVLRDRLKAPAKTKQVMRELISQSPTNDGHTQNSVNWLLYNPANENEFKADVALILKARRQHIHLAAFRNMPAAWAKAARKNKDHKQHAQFVQAELAKVDAEPFIKEWYAGSASTTSAAAAQARTRLLAPAVFNTLSDDAIRTLLNAQAYYYRHYAPGNQRAQTGATYARFVAKFPKDYALAIAYLQSATDYGPAELAREAALHLMKFKPESSDSDLFRRLMIAADNNKDAALTRQALNWITQSEQAFGKKLGYAYYIGDFLVKYELQNEAVAYWQSHVDLDRSNVDCRHCAERLLARIEGAPRIPFLQKLVTTPSDYHGTYSMWLAGEFLKAGNLDAFVQTLQASRKSQDERPFRNWGMEDAPVQAWIDRYRNDKEATPEQKQRVFTAARDLRVLRCSATATLALLELVPAATQKPIPRLLAYQAATRLVYDSSYDWDRLRPYVDAALLRKDYISAATLLSGMLSNISGVDVTRKQSGREMVAQSYSRMGAVGLTIDSDSPIAPLLQAALYLRLGDEKIAYDAYLANKALFDEHRNEVPVDLLLFVCESHMAAGGDDNYDRVEDLLRSWVVKHSESKQFDNKTKAKVQLLLASNFAKAHRFDIARSEFTTVLNRYPDTPQALEAEFGIGETFMEQKVFDQAELVFDKLANSRDADVVVRAQFLRGVLAYRRGDRDEAREIFRGVLERVPDIELANRALFSLAEVFGDEERYIDQLNLLRTVGRLGRSSKRWHNPGTSLSIVVQDSDLGISRGRSEIRVIVTTEPGGDVEEIKLTSGGAGKGLFRADLDTRLGQVVQRDKVLQLTGKDTIKCDYPEDFKKEFHRIPLSDVEIHIAADGEFEIASSQIVDQEELSITTQLQKENEDAEDQDQRVSQVRPANQIKPGNTIYMRTKDGDRDLTGDVDRIVVKLKAESGDEVQVFLSETDAHSGVFEGTAKTGELPAGALASDTAIEHSPLMAIDQDKDSFWLSEPDGATPKSLTIDMKDLKLVSRLRVSTPEADRRAFVRGELLGSNDGRFWFRVAGNPALPQVEPVADDFGQMTRRVFSGNYTNYSTWNQVLNLARNSQPTEEGQADELERKRPEDPEDEKAKKKPYAVVWHGKLVQERDGAARIQVQGARTAIVVDGNLQLPVGPGGRSVDVWLDRGTHELTIFAAAAGTQTASARMARADHNSADVTLVPFQEADFDLTNPAARPALVRDIPRTEINETEWNFAFDPHELRFVRFIIHEYLGEAIAVNNIEIAGEDADQIYIPTEADVLSLSENNVLEIAGGDIVTATYTDEFTQRQSGGSRLITAQLTATYYNAAVSPIAYDFVKQNNGTVITQRKELMRIDPGERIIIEIVDFDRDQSNKPDTVKFEVIVNDGMPVEFEATENDDYSGTFTKEIDTSPNSEADKIHVKRGDRVYLRYIDSQNTFPGHAVARESVVFVNQPTEGQVRIVETRVQPQDPETNRPAVISYLPRNPEQKVASVAFEAPLTVEVIDPDAAKDSRSSITVQLKTTDGATVDVRCVISNAFAKNALPADVNWALREGRFVGQVIQQLGSKSSPAVVPVTIGMPRNIIGGAIDPEDVEGGGLSDLDRNLITRVLNLTGQDKISAAYQDLLRPAAPAKTLTSQGRLVTNGTLACTGRGYDNEITQVHVGEKLFLIVVDADQDSSDERDAVEIEITSEFGEKETFRLPETLAHSGIFSGSVTLKSNEQPTAGNLNPEMPVIECYFGDTLHIKYIDLIAGTEKGQLEVLRDVPVVIGTDGLVSAFSKTFNDEKLAVETKFHIAESYFELFKSHKSLGRNEEEQADLKAGRRILSEVMEDYPDPKYTPRIAYLLGQFSQELQQWDDAIESYEMIIRRFGDHTLAADAQYKLAQCHEESGDFDQALEAYVTLAATYPRSPLIANVMIRISDHFYRGKNYKVAAQVGEKFLEKFSNHQYASRIAFRVGQCFYKDKNYVGAGAAFDRFSKKFPEDNLTADSLFWSGESFRMARNNRFAFQRYNRCRWDFPASDAAKYARGRLALPEMLQQFEAEVNSLDDNN